MDAGDASTTASKLRFQVVRTVSRYSPATQQFPVSHFARKNRGVQKTLFANSCTVFLLADWSSASEITGVLDCVTKLTLLNISGNCWPATGPISSSNFSRKVR